MTIRRRQRRPSSKIYTGEHDGNSAPALIYIVYQFLVGFWMNLPFLHSFGFSICDCFSHFLSFHRSDTYADTVKINCLLIYLECEKNKKKKKTQKRHPACWAVEFELYVVNSRNENLFALVGWSIAFIENELLLLFPQSKARCEWILLMYRILIIFFFLFFSQKKMW